MLAQNLRNLMCRRILLSRETASARNRGDQPKGASRVGTTRWRRDSRTDVVGKWLIYIELKGRDGQESNRLILHENGKETKIGRFRAEYADVDLSMLMISSCVDLSMLMISSC